MPAVTRSQYMKNVKPLKQVVTPDQVLANTFETATTSIAKLDKSINYVSQIKNKAVANSLYGTIDVCRNKLLELSYEKNNTIEKLFNDVYQLIDKVDMDNNTTTDILTDILNISKHWTALHRPGVLANRRRYIHNPCPEILYLDNILTQLEETTNVINAYFGNNGKYVSKWVRDETNPRHIRFEEHETSSKKKNKTNSRKK